jgi:hypothetical protein
MKKRIGSKKYALNIPSALIFKWAVQTAIYETISHKMISYLKGYGIPWAQAEIHLLTLSPFLFMLSTNHIMKETIIMSSNNVKGIPMIENLIRYEGKAKTMSIMAHLG